jgi:hypothetical protein
MLRRWQRGAKAAVPGCDDAGAGRVESGESGVESAPAWWPKGALSPDGMIPEKGAETALRALASIDPEIAKATLDLSAVHTNDFVKQANAKYPRG